MSSEDELHRALEAALEADNWWERLRVLGVQPQPPDDIEKHIAAAAERTIHDYRKIVWRLLLTIVEGGLISDGMRDRIWRKAQRLQGLKNPGDPNSRNETIEAWQKLADEGVPEHKRAKELSALLNIPRNTMNKRIRQLGLRTLPPTLPK